MSTQVLAWLGSVFVVLLAAAVLWLLVWAACWVVAWAWNWRSFRGDDQDGHTEGHEDDGESIGLPPERTWEQMTSHQLPVTAGDLGVVSITRHIASLAPARERRPPWWEVQQRDAYEAMGFDYPSGLMARVRELTS